jgi:NTP pyrophosphatase (non-canonical NTP hydrolase)
MAHRAAKEKGFWQTDEKKMLIKRNIGELLMLIVSELGEALEALRRNDRQELNTEWRKNTFEDEIADAVIRLLDLCAAESIPLEKQILKKLEYNKTRPYKHGKEF